jgi:hypothetical protein
MPQSYEYSSPDPKQSKSLSREGRGKKNHYITKCFAQHLIHLFKQYNSFDRPTWPTATRYQILGQILANWHPLHLLRILKNNTYIITTVLKKLAHRSRIICATSVVLRIITHQSIQVTNMLAAKQNPTGRYVSPS